MALDIDRTEEDEGMNFEQLVSQIRAIHDQLAKQASKAVNLGLTLRNWLIGCHIQEFELRGDDRSQYGERLFDNLADRLGKLGVPSCDRRQLYRYVDFYRQYPQFVGTLSPQFRGMLPSRPSAGKVGTMSPRSTMVTLPPEALVEALSYSHFELLTALEDTLKRAFYEAEMRAFIEARLNEELPEGTARLPKSTKGKREKAKLGKGAASEKRQDRDKRRRGEKRPWSQEPSK